MEDITLRSEINGGTVDLYPEGRLYSPNVPDFQAELDRILPEKIEKIVIHADKLEYISSAGLRVVMKLKKTYGNLEILDVNPDVYDVFEMTGFCELMPIKKALRTVSVAGCTAIASGANGKVYRLSEDSICKVFLGFSSKAMIEDEISRSRTAFVYGIPCAISFDMVRCEEGYGLVYEMLQSKTLAKRFAQEPEEMDKLLDAYVALAKKLGTTVLPKGTLPDEKESVLELAERCRPYVDAKALEDFKDFVRAIPDANVFLHTDLHGNNVMFVEGEMNLIDMADAAQGHPVFDILTIAHAYQLFQSRSDDALYERIMGMPPQVGCQVWEGFCRRYFEGLDPQVAADRRLTSELMAWLFVIRANIVRLESNAIAPEVLPRRIKEITDFVEKILPENRDFLLKTLEAWK